MRTLIVGAGAVGGYFGGRLLEAGRPVTFLVRPPRAAALQRDGLQVHSPHGHIHCLAPPWVLARQVAEPCELILLACKAFDLPAAMQDFAPAVGPDTLILPLLNGMRHLDCLGERFGQDAVLGGQCLAALEQSEQGVIRHLDHCHQLRFGELDGSSSTRILRVAEALADAGFEASFSQHIVQDMWDRGCFTAALAALILTFRALPGDILAAGGRPLLASALDECARLALAAGHPLSAQARQRCLALLGQPSSLGTSLLRDIECGGPTEARQWLDDLLAHRPAIAHPPGDWSMLHTARLHLRAHEAQHRHEGTYGL